MNNLLNIKTPAEGIAQARKADYNLSNHGIGNLRLAYWNLPGEALHEEAVFRNEGATVRGGPFVAFTGVHTARSANDKFVVREGSTEAHVWWGQYNRPMAPEKFDELYARLLGYLQGRDLFVQDVYGGADENYRLPVRLVTELAWHSMFARNMFVLPQSLEEYKRFVPDFTLLAVPGFKSAPSVDNTNTETFIALSFEKKLAIIGNSAYAGEIKKSVFTILNYLLPLEGVLSMHCSANVSPSDPDDVALFFGLSGTGKTTLSADPTRRLIGDDEHGWSDEGVFNFEGGCYAKVIGLSEAAEPEIYATTRMYGTIPIARLSPEQALYQFISGYTAKIAGTEVGLRDEPEITFSACFGGPFMVHHPYQYAELLRNKIERYDVACWLVNTGWVGGPYGVGKRISIRHTRNLLNAALTGKLAGVDYYTDPVFGFSVPKSCPDVPPEVLQPWSSWPSRAEYDKRYKDLAQRFLENFKKFEDGTPREVVEAGSRV